MRDDRVLDLFAGPGGWDEGVRALGLRPVGIEWDAAACKTARAAGHVRFQHDIAALDPREFATGVFDGPVRGLIASPPCQGFSQAGKQQGRKDAATLLAAIPEMTRRDVRPELREGMADSRSILVLEPLRWALALTPSWMAWEQVPAVLPIWERCAEVLRSLGYTVATGNLSAEQHGVPQTRKRAILVARAPWMTAAMGPAALPVPTHSRYYSRSPQKLDAGVLPWVSMAEALGWGMTARPYPTIAGGTGGGPDPLLVGGSNARDFIKGEHAAGGDRWIQQSNYSGPGAPGATAAERGLGERPDDVPSFAVTSKGFRWLRHNQGYRDRPVDPDTGKARVRNEDGSDYYQRFDTDAPAPSLTTQVDAWKWTTPPARTAGAGSRAGVSCAWAPARTPPSAARTSPRPPSTSVSGSTPSSGRTPPARPRPRRR
jgi:DNA (cytosine-5)-methyltransferase 1